MRESGYLAFPVAEMRSPSRPRRRSRQFCKWPALRWREWPGCSQFSKYHHAHARDYRNGAKSHHIDPSKWLIFLLAQVGAAGNLHRASTSDATP